MDGGGHAPCGMLDWDLVGFTPPPPHPWTRRWTPPRNLMDAGLRLLRHPRAPLDVDLEDVGTLVEKPSKDL